MWIKSVFGKEQPREQKSIKRHYVRTIRVCREYSVIEEEEKKIVEEREKKKRFESRLKANNNWNSEVKCWFWSRGLPGMYSWKAGGFSSSSSFWGGSKVRPPTPLKRMGNKKDSRR